MANDLKKIVEMVVRIKDEASATLKKTGQNLKELSDTSKKTEKAIDGVGAGAKRTAAAMDSSAKSAKKLDQAVEQVGDKSRKTERDLDRLGKSSEGVAGLIGLAVSSLTGIVFPVVQAAQFQRAMSEVQAITGATDSQLVQLTHTASELGRTTEYTGVQAAEGLKYLAMAGLSAQQAISALPGTLQLAQAGAMDLGQSADIVTNILSGYNLQTKELGRVNDVLVQTFTNTNSTLHEIGEAMKYVGPVASSMGADFEELTATIGLLHNAGIKASMAGTTLRQIMSLLSSPSSEAAEVLGKVAERLDGVNLQLQDSNGNWIGFISVIKQFEAANLTAVEALEMLGERGGPGLAALIALGSDSLERLTELNKKAQGRAEEISRVMQKNVVGSYRQATSATQGLAIATGNLLLPAVDKLLKGFVELLTWTTNLIIKYETASKVVAGLAAAITLLAAAIGTLVGARATAFAFVGLFKAGGLFAGATAQLVLFGKGIALVAATVGGWVAALAVTVTGVVAFAAAWALSSDEFKNWVREFKILGVEVQDWWSLISAYFQAGFVTLFGGIENLFVKTGSMLKNLLGVALAHVADWGISVVKVIGAIPGLGKLLGWDDDANGAIQALERLKAGAVGMSEASQKASQSATDQYNNLLAQSSGAIEAEERKIAAIQAVMAARKLQMDLEKEISAAAEEIDRQRASGLEAVTSAYTDAGDKLEEKVKQYNALNELVRASLADLHGMLDAQVAYTWNSATSDDVVKKYTDMLAKMETSTEAWGDIQTDKATRIQNDANDAKLEAIKDSVHKAAQIYEQELQNIATYENARVDLTKFTGEQRANEEAKIVEKIEISQVEILEKKKSFYQQAKDSLVARLNESLEKEKEIAGQIISLNARIAESKMTTDERLQELKRKSMSEDEVYKDKEREYQTYLEKAQDNIGKNYEEAMKWAEKAQSVAVGLTKETKEGTIETGNAIGKVTEAQEVMDEAGARRSSQLMSSLADTKNSTEAARESLQTVSDGLSALGQKLEEGFKLKIDVQEELFLSQIATLQERVKMVTKLEIDLNQAGAELKAFQDTTMDMKAKVFLELETEAHAAIIEQLNSTDGALGKLREGAKIELSKGEGFDPITEALLDLAGIKEGIGVPIGISVSDDGTIATATQTVAEFKDSIDETLKSITTIGETKTEFTVGVTDETKAEVLGFNESLDKTQKSLLEIRETKTEPNVIISDKVKVEISEFKNSIDETQKSLEHANRTEAELKAIVSEKTKEDVAQFKEALSDEQLRKNISIIISIPGLDNAIQKVKALADCINGLKSKTVTITQITKKVDGGSSSGTASPVKARTGKRIGGFGGGDIVPAMLEPGEWVIRKEAVKKVGDGFMARLNAGLVGRLPGFKTGGKVPKIEDETMEQIAAISQELGEKEKITLQEWQAINRKLNGEGGYWGVQTKGAASLIASNGIGPYKGVGSAYPDTRSIQAYMKMVMKSKPRPAGEYEKVFEPINEMIQQLESLGGESAYQKLYKSHHAEVRKQSFGSSARSLTDAQIDYAMLLGQGGDNTDSDKKDSQAGFGNVIKSLAKGESLKLPDMNPKMPSLKKIEPREQTIKHSIDFNIGEKTVGPFSGEKTSITDLIDELKKSQRLA